MKLEETFLPATVYTKGYSREHGLTSVGKGWSGLVNRAFDELSKYDPHVVVIQVKEKYGGLRIYSSPYHEEFDRFITELEKESFTICEECGAPGQLRSGGWYVTLCDEHAKGRTPIDPF